MFPLVLQPVFAVPVGLLVAALLIVGVHAQRRRREDQRALRESEQRLRTLVESAPEALGILDVETRRFIEVNENAAQLFGLDEAAMFHVDPFELSPGVMPDGSTSVEVAAQCVDQAMQGRTPVVEWVALTGEGTLVPCELKLARLPSLDRPLLRVSLVDIRERAAAQREREELEEQLQQAQKLEALGKLTGGVAHDFNNLLTVIKGSLELLREDVSDDPDLGELVESAHEAALRSAQLTQRLLAFSRKQALRPQLIDIAALIGGLEDLLSRSLGETIRLELSGSEETWLVHADLGQLESSIVNLAVNARDAMPAGGSLRIAADNVLLKSDEAEALGLEEGDYVELSVSDDGEGMHPNVASRAFDPFFTTKAVGEGSGLGLSMVYGFVSQSGGSVRLESERGKGTVVRLYLPRCQPESPRDGRSEPSNAPGT